MKSISRKSFLRSSGIAVAALPFGLSDLSACSFNDFHPPYVNSDKTTISIFSKNLQWANFKHMAALVAKMGFDGIDLTVRKGGHVSPENVLKDLPLAVKAIRDEGINVFTITTDIKRAGDLHTRDILKTAAQLDIRNYRMGWYNYNAAIAPMLNIDVIKKELKALAVVNEEYQIHGDYQNHHGRFGAPIWDLWLALKDLNPKWIGSQFDIRHATLDGAESWPVSVELIKNYIGSIAIKDFYWKNTGKQWEAVNAPLGEGMVNFKAYFKLLKKFQISRPISLHYEYPLGGAESGSTKLTIAEEVVIEKMKLDLTTLKSWLAV